MESDGPQTWTTEQVSDWLDKKGFKNYSNLLCTVHRIDGSALLQLTEEDLRQPPVSMQALGDIKRLANELIKLRNETFSKNPNLISQFPASLVQSQYTFSSTLYNGFMRSTSSLQAKQQQQQQQQMRRKQQVQMSEDQQLDRPNSVDQHPSVYSDVGSTNDQDATNFSTFLEPEFLKLFFATIYMTFSLMLTTFVMVIVHDRVPDMTKYPPLPDIVLDNVPYIPWAFEACETLMLALGILLTITLVFHKHRFIIMRRLFALCGTVFLLRCITMLITSLSVPGSHLKCQPRALKTFRARVETAFNIYTGFGMSIKGVTTCGDYMFSGHTVVTTMFNFFLSEYTPRSIPMLHTLGWVFNFFAIFFILAGHEHYSIDVFVAFYITSRLFLYYHSLANNRVLLQQDARTRVWFPLFTYFEFSMNGSIPNEYEFPWMTFGRFIFRKVKKLFGMRVSEDNLGTTQIGSLKRSLSIASFGIGTDVWDSRIKVKQKSL